MSFLKRLISVTRPVRYAVDAALYGLLADKSALLSLRDKHKGSPMLVVGNGPSLNQTPLDKFAGIPSVGMNKIDLIYPRTAWRPSVVVCLNNMVAKQHQNQFVDSSIPTFVAWKARWMIQRKNRNHFSYFNSLISNNFSENALRGFGSSATVTYIALQMAYWMGANPVILFGVDHCFSYSGENGTYQKRVGEDQNHFDPRYFQEGVYWGTPDLMQSERDYAIARRHFELGGREILDATIGGKLQVFEKISVAAALNIVTR